MSAGPFGAGKYRDFIEAVYSWCESTRGHLRGTLSQRACNTLTLGITGLAETGTEPHRVCRRPFRLSYAATAGASSMA